MTDRIPPVAPEGFAWMPMPARWHLPESIGLAVYDTKAGWEHFRADGCGGPPNARLMRRLGPDEAPWEGCYESIGGRTWTAWPAEHSGGASFDVMPRLYAPVRFAGRAPDFGETGLRLVDPSEVVDEFGCVPTEQGPALPITLPPLPKPEREASDPIGGLNAALDRLDAVIGVDGLRAEVERLQARLREAEAERDEARAELARVREAARDALSDDSAAGYQTYRCTLRRIADGEV